MKILWGKLGYLRTKIFPIDYKKDTFFRKY